MTERALGWGFRALLGVLGAGALVSALLVGLAQIRALSRGSPPVLAVAALIVCALVAIGGVSLLSGAIRGSIRVRRTQLRGRRR